jgi:TatA/E family protein of Tat protein translocase
LRLVFGRKKLPELGQGLGDGMREFKEGMKDPRESNPSENKKA